MTPYPTTVLADRPVAYWRFGESSGVDVADATGNGHGCALSGGYVRGMAGALAGDGDAAVALDGGSGQATAPDTPTLRLSATLTLEVWYRTTATGPQALIVKGEGSYYLMLNPDEGAPGQLAIYLAAVSDATGGWLRDPASSADGQWHHAAATYDGITIRLFRDGAEVASRPVPGAVAVNTSDLSIGSRAGEGGTFFHGALDEAAVYGAALGAARVRAHYALGRATGSVAPPIGSSRIVASSSTRSSR